MELILASTSVHRKKQLDDLKLKFQPIAPLFDEDRFKNENSLPFEELCLELGSLKAKSLIEFYSDDIIVGSDQMLVFKNTIYNKPKDEEECFKRLSLLQGSTHYLLTSLAIYTPSKRFKHVDKTELTMKPLTEKEIKDYIQKDKPMGCAGGYKYEQNGNKLFKKVSSEDPSSIVGLPTKKLLAILKEIGFKNE